VGRAPGLERRAVAAQRAGRSIECVTRPIVGVARPVVGIICGDTPRDLIMHAVRLPGPFVVPGAKGISCGVTSKAPSSLSPR